MAINNRAEAILITESTLVPTLTLAQHRAMLKDNILNSVKFDKDVIASETPVAGAVTIDYADKDLATVTTAVDLAVSFTNLENGAVKYLEVTKAAANVISFVGALDRVNFRDYINTVETVVVYRVSNKNGNIYIEALFAPGSSVFSTISFSTAYYTGNLKYRINLFSGKIEIEIQFTCIQVISTTFALAPNITQINAAAIPDRAVWFPLINNHSEATVPSEAVACRINTDGYIKTHLSNLRLNEEYYGYFEYYKVLPE